MTSTLTQTRLFRFRNKFKCISFHSNSEFQNGGIANAAWTFPPLASDVLKDDKTKSGEEGVYYSKDNKNLLEHSAHQQSHEIDREIATIEVNWRQRTRK